MHQLIHLYASRMDVELRQLRCLVAIVDEGTFTDAAIALGVSQAAVSRTLASLERALGVRLLRRTSREVTPTGTGLRVVAHARRVLGEVDDLVREAASGHAYLRIGYAWSALGRHTLDFQRRWSATHPETDLQLIRVNSATAGLAEGACDVSVVRRPLDDRRFDSAIVGLERRLCAMASDRPEGAAGGRRRGRRLLPGRAQCRDGGGPDGGRRPGGAEGVESADGGRREARRHAARSPFVARSS
jgi:DNA-binding transcriptional LysR family regulator